MVHALRALLRALVSLPHAATHRGLLRGRPDLRLRGQRNLGGGADEVHPKEGPPGLGRWRSDGVGKNDPSNQALYVVHREFHGH